MLPSPISARPPIPVSLACAAEASRWLTAAGCEIHTAYDNGRRMVLLINQPPPLVIGHKRSWHPNGRGGISTLFAAEYHGCQLEWFVDTEGVRTDEPPAPQRRETNVIALRSTTYVTRPFPRRSSKPSPDSPTECQP